MANHKETASPGEDGQSAHPHFSSPSFPPCLSQDWHSMFSCRMCRVIQHHELPVSKMNRREKTPSEESTRYIQCKKREKKQMKEKSTQCNSHTGRGRKEERTENRTKIKKEGWGWGVAWGMEGGGGSAMMTSSATGQPRKTAEARGVKSRVEQGSFGGNQRRCR